MSTEYIAKDVYMKKLFICINIFLAHHMLDAQNQLLRKFMIINKTPDLVEVAIKDVQGKDIKFRVLGTGNAANFQTIDLVGKKGTFSGVSFIKSISITNSKSSNEKNTVSDKTIKDLNDILLKSSPKPGEGLPGIEIKKFGYSGTVNPKIKL